MKVEEFGTRTDVKQKSGIMLPFQWSEAQESFVLVEPRAKDYASECNELVWLQKIRALRDFGLILQKSKKS